MYNRIWNEAVRLRTNGELLAVFKNIQSKLLFYDILQAII